MSSTYRNYLLWGVGGLIIGAAATLFTMTAVARNTLIEEYRSTASLEATVDQIVKNAEAQGWRVTAHELEQQGTPEKHADRVQVIHLCNRDYTGDLLALGTSNRAVAMVPNTVVVYQKGNEVLVAHLDTAKIGRIFRRESAGAMRSLRQDEKAIFGFLAKR
jgi:hypothetical protein